VIVISFGSFLGVSALSLGMVLTPGPNMMYVVSRSISQGRRAGLISLGGVGLGFIAYIAATTLGLSALFVAVPVLYMALKTAGAAYLLWLAWRVIRPGGVSPFAPVPLTPDSPRRLFTMGLVTNLLNPKAAILYATLIPQFLNVSAGHLVVQGFILGGIQMMISLLVNSCWVLTAGTVAIFLALRPTWLRIQRYVTGGVIGAIALKLATDRARPLA
jgi:threonine/homoserine/homoserine lactone efflux protein